MLHFEVELEVAYELSSRLMKGTKVLTLSASSLDDLKLLSSNVLVTSRSVHAMHLAGCVIFYLVCNFFSTWYVTTFLKQLTSATLGSSIRVALVKD